MCMIMDADVARSALGRTRGELWHRGTVTVTGTGTGGGGCITCSHHVCVCVCVCVCVRRHGAVSCEKTIAPSLRALQFGELVGS
jgi:hypothetical protein